MTHPAVMDAAVFGIPHRVLGEEVGASCRIKPDMWGKVTSQQLRDHVATKIAKFKVPAYIDLVNEPLPANPAGKVLKRQLRGEVAEKAAKSLGGDFQAKL
jgi:long-chain acyl-CoA synthetase